MDRKTRRHGRQSGSALEKARESSEEGLTPFPAVKPGSPEHASRLHESIVAAENLERAAGAATNQQAEPHNLRLIGFLKWVIGTLIAVYPALWVLSFARTREIIIETPHPVPDAHFQFPLERLPEELKAQFNQIDKGELYLPDLTGVVPVVGRILYVPLPPAKTEEDLGPKPIGDWILAVSRALGSKIIYRPEVETKDETKVETDSKSKFHFTLYHDHARESDYGDSLESAARDLAFNTLAESQPDSAIAVLFPGLCENGSCDFTQTCITFRDPIGKLHLGNLSDRASLALAAFLLACDDASNTNPSDNIERFISRPEKGSLWRDAKRLRGVWWWQERNIENNRQKALEQFWLGLCHADINTNSKWSTETCATSDYDSIYDFALAAYFTDQYKDQAAVAVNDALKASKNEARFLELSCLLDSRVKGFEDVTPYCKNIPPDVAVTVIKVISRKKCPDQPSQGGQRSGRADNAAPNRSVCASSLSGGKPI